MTGCKMAVASAIPYAICTRLQTDNHTNSSSVNFYRPDAFADVKPTVSKNEGKLNDTRGFAVIPSICVILCH